MVPSNFMIDKQSLEKAEDKQTGLFFSHIQSRN